ncbi:Uncharacterized protein Rs2_30931 [Raphanus sativus]|uniref:Cyclin-dependent protein kinase inhibitor SMR11 isoform X2 n=1 Tax=Raphanus sativus TaxID=3726 RepID=A0A6J0JMU1_RAPSA|nr:cyclin-dependent protein kinase inhibitor SMR11 isoform X2 [Raphanus sativus]KAJ4891183.1 Uncharacterized protein Rs2_30931 [Raphanus sativus]
MAQTKTYSASLSGPRTLPFIPLSQLSAILSFFNRFDNLVNPMDQEGRDPCEVKKASIEPKTPTADDPDSISLSEEELITDEEIVESIYDSLFQIILVVQLQQGSAETWCFDDCPTPSSPAATKKVPDTCPGAPMQLSKIWRNNGSSGSGRPRRILF